MKKFSSFLAMTALAFMFVLFVSPVESVFAEIADGTYEINYEMKEAGSDNTSIADGYFTKPATLTVKDGVKQIQFTVTSASMVKSLSGPNGPVDVVSEGDDTRTVKFTVNDLSSPVSMDMHIKVPDMPEMPGGYDMQHTARAAFDVSGLEQTEAPATEDESSDDTAATADSDNADDEAAAGSEKTEENPPTGDSTPITFYALLLLASGAGIFLIFKKRQAHN